MFVATTACGTVGRCELIARLLATVARSVTVGSRRLARSGRSEWTSGDCRRRVPTAFVAMVRKRSRVRFSQEALFAQVTALQLTGSRCY